jgi:hypothetical protein
MELGPIVFIGTAFRHTIVSIPDALAIGVQSIPRCHIYQCGASISY